MSRSDNESHPNAWPGLIRQLNEKLKPVDQPPILLVFLFPLGMSNLSKEKMAQLEDLKNKNLIRGYAPIYKDGPGYDWPIDTTTWNLDNIGRFKANLESL